MNAMMRKILSVLNYIIFWFITFFARNKDYSTHTKKLYFEDGRMTAGAVLFSVTYILTFLHLSQIFST
jgi:hypothetical protein